MEQVIIVILLLLITFLLLVNISRPHWHPIWYRLREKTPWARYWYRTHH